MWVLISLVPALRRQKQGDLFEFQASQCYIVRFCIKKLKRKKKKKPSKLASQPTNQPTENTEQSHRSERTHAQDGGMFMLGGKGIVGSFQSQD